MHRSALSRSDPLTRLAAASTGCRLALALLFAVASAGRAEPPTESPGLAIYREHCLRCHGENGAGTAEVPAALVGDRSVNQLADYIHDTMPEDDPEAVAGEAARAVAAAIHETFYSAVARDRNRPARVELARLTNRELRNTLADLVRSFRGGIPRDDGRRGLVGEYFSGSNFDRGKGLVFERIDPGVAFDFGVEGPDPELFLPHRFSIRWRGSLLAPETGTYEIVVRTEHAVRLQLNQAWYEPPFVDGWVKSGAENEYRRSVFLLGGRPYRLALEFSKANQGVDSQQHPPAAHAAIELLWKPPHGVLEPVPERCLAPWESPPTFVPSSPLPPDDRSIGYDRGTSVSPEWFAAATAVAVETADHVVNHLEHLARVKRDAPDRADKLRAFCGSFAERAFRHPLSADLRALVIERPFADAPDLDTAVKRSVLLVLQSPRFLFREPAGATADPFVTAARLSFGLCDSLPDGGLWDAASRKQLGDPEQVARQAERMLDDPRTRAKLREFLLHWLRVAEPREIVKDRERYAEFTPEVVADLRTSLLLAVDEALDGRSDGFQRLLTAEEVWLSGRLAPLYGASLWPEAAFRPVRIDGGRRGGVLSHPYLMSMLAYADDSSPIHRGVFLARSVLGNVLKPPKEAITPLAPDTHPDLTTRERVALQTEAVACQTCHTMINPLGFALEEFDAVGRYRAEQRVGSMTKPIDSSGSYLPREGPEATFRGGRELAAYVAASPDAREAFVQHLFHALVRQPVRAWGPDTLPALTRSFADSGCNIRRLAVDIMKVACFPPEPTP
jgi:mono/diheme cytochrome c family protein